MSATIRHSEIVFNLDFYPREQVDRERVEQLTEALKSGATLPPIIVDQKRRLVDGYHRARAHRAAYGEDVLIPCEFREYENDTDLFLDAVRLNASHGKPLTEADRGYTVALARRLGVEVAQLASVLNVRVARVESLRGTSKPAEARGLVVQRPPHKPKPAPLAARMRERSDPPVGLAEINKVIIGLKGGKVNVRDSAVRQSLENLAHAIRERLEVAA